MQQFSLSLSHGCIILVVSGENESSGFIETKLKVGSRLVSVIHLFLLAGVDRDVQERGRESWQSWTQNWSLVAVHQPSCRLN